VGEGKEQQRGGVEVRGEDWRVRVGLGEGGVGRGVGERRGGEWGEGGRGGSGGEGGRGRGGGGGGEGDGVEREEKVGCLRI